MKKEDSGRARNVRRGRPPRAYRLTDASGDVFVFEGATLVALVLGVKKQTVYNAVSSGKAVAGCRVERVGGNTRVLRENGRKHTAEEYIKAWT